MEGINAAYKRDIQIKELMNKNSCVAVCSDEHIRSQTDGISTFNELYFVIGYRKTSLKHGQVTIWYKL